MDRVITILVLGIVGRTGGVNLPEQSDILSNPLILITAGTHRRKAYQTRRALR